MSFTHTRSLHLDAGQQRDDAVNRCTRMVFPAVTLEFPGFRGLFLEHYSTIRRRCLRFDRPGIAAFAFDSTTGELAASMAVAAKVGMANSAIIGRHSLADLYLADDDALSLRHLALVIDPLRSANRFTSTDIRLRILDLRTRLAFEDEHGNKLGSVVAEGPLFIRCGKYALMFLPTGEPTDWPCDCLDAWECIPERVYLEEDSPVEELARPRPVLVHAGKQKPITLVQTGLAPAMARKRLVADGEMPVGTLRIETDERTETLLVGERAIRRGILLGRYNRCDADSTTILDNPNVSRVHCLIVGAGEQLVAIDTASTNGTYLNSTDTEVRLTALEPGRPIVLGNELARVRWCPVN